VRAAPPAPTVRDTVALDRNWLSAEFEYAPVMLPARDPGPEAEQVDPSLEETVAEAELVPTEAEAEAEAEAGEPELVEPSEDELDADEVAAAVLHVSAPVPAVPAAPAEDRYAGTAISSVPPVVWDPPVPTTRLTPAPSGGVVPASAAHDEIEDNELTRIVPRRGVGVRFVLQFSTGESVVVAGSGLLGRNPVPEPGEAFELLVPITDAGKSVSKTHLEFGQEQGTFWILDRYSANGSVIREPNVAPRRLEPGRAYRVTRGARVDIGEQFVVVS
jgi:hypothetical protein